MPLHSLGDLHRMAQAGDGVAMTDLAARLLEADDAAFAPEEGVAWLEKAAAADNPEALCMLATLRAGGAWTHFDLPEAIDLLRRSAEGGSEDACAQLLLLSDDAELAAHIRIAGIRNENWGRLSESVNLQAWMTPGRPRQVSEIPRVWIAEKFASRQFCDWLIGRAIGKFRPAMMRDATTGVSHALDSRTCSDFVFDIFAGGVALLLLRMKISVITSIPVSHMEPPQIFHYGIGEEIKPHHDFLFDGEHGYGHAGRYQGDRLATFLLYLNEGYEGGEIEFPRIGYRHRGRTGDCIFFASQRDGKPDPMSLHGAAKVTLGEKYILSQWIHNQPFAA